MKRITPEDSLETNNTHNAKKKNYKSILIDFSVIREFELEDAYHSRNGYMTIYDSEDHLTTIQEYINQQIPLIKKDFNITPIYMPKVIIIRYQNSTNNMPTLFNSSGTMPAFFNSCSNPVIFLDIIPPPTIIYNKNNDLKTYNEYNPIFITPFDVDVSDKISKHENS